MENPRASVLPPWRSTSRRNLRPFAPGVMSVGSNFSLISTVLAFAMLSLCVRVSNDSDSLPGRPEATLFGRVKARCGSPPRAPDWAGPRPRRRGVGRQLTRTPKSSKTNKRDKTCMPHRNGHLPKTEGGPRQRVKRTLGLTNRYARRRRPQRCSTRQLIFARRATAFVR